MYEKWNRMSRTWKDKVVVRNAIRWNMTHRFYFSCLAFCPTALPSVCQDFDTLTIGNIDLLCNHYIHVHFVRHVHFLLLLLNVFFVFIAGYYVALYLCLYYAKPHRPLLHCILSRGIVKSLFIKQLNLLKNSICLFSSFRALQNA